MLPTRPQQGPSPWPIVWVPAKTNGVLNILQNPAYAGAYVYGKTTIDPSPTSATRPRFYPIYGIFST
jgi:hypothetical protein